MKKRGFTLIELLVVVAIIGTLITIATFSISTLRAKGRDTKRVTDIKKIQLVLENYYRDEQSYPTSINFGGDLLGTRSSTTYMSSIPNNPAPQADGACANDNYAYQKLDNGSYELQFCLSATSSDIASGLNCATPKGVVPGKCPSISSCGRTITIASIKGHNCNTGAPDYDTCTYGTIQIGSQCWMKTNMNIGVNNSNFSDDNNLEKIFVNTANGSLYQWAEAMGFPKACNSSAYYADLQAAGSQCGLGGQTYKIDQKHQGICPSGWHIPSDNELHELVATSSPTSCDLISGWGCVGAADSLKQASDCYMSGTDICGRSGFNFILSGFNGGAYGDNGYMWSAYSELDQGTSYYYRVSRTYDGVYRAGSSRDVSFSIRCLRN
ncbi:MAG: FISUMP domain-containing protein [Candidatus Falkowbacteria bacterium]